MGKTYSHSNTDFQNTNYERERDRNGKRFFRRAKVAMATECEHAQRRGARNWRHRFERELERASHLMVAKPEQKAAKLLLPSPKAKINSQRKIANTTTSESHGEIRSSDSSRVACICVAGKQSLETFAEACYRFTPQIAIREGEAIFLELWGSRKLFTPTMIEKRLQVLAKRFGLQVTIAFSDSPGMALAKARYGSEYSHTLPVEALQEIVSPFEFDEHLQKKLRFMIHNIRTLGVYNLEQFLSLSPKALALRFGKEGAEVSRWIHEARYAPWPRFTIPERICEYQELDEFSPTVYSGTLEPLAFHLKALVDRAMARLWARGQRASVVELELTIERLSIVKQRQRISRIAFVYPQTSSRSIMPILREKLAAEFQKVPLVAALEAIEFRVIETVPNSGAQKNFFHKELEEKEAWSNLINRMQARLGKDGVFQAEAVDRMLPEKAWRKSADYFYCEPGRERANSKLQDIDPKEYKLSRPSRLLQKPERIELRRFANQEVLFHSGWQKRWHVESMSGPERLSGEWWRSAPDRLPLERDYFRAYTKEGETLWIFASPHKKEFFLQGFFD